VLTTVRAGSAGAERSLVVTKDVTAGQLLAVCNPLVYTRVQPSDFADHPVLKGKGLVCTHAICQLVLVCICTLLLIVSPLSAPMQPPCVPLHASQLYLTCKQSMHVCPILRSVLSAASATSTQLTGLIMSQTFA